jgi:curved DNA-binding protein CbpA
LKDYYKILGVNSFASAEGIKLAYRTLAKRYHPDLNPGDFHAEERFKEINEAYDTLSDEIKRKKYDFKRMYGATAYPTGQPKTQTKEDPQREWAKREAFIRHAKRKQKESAQYNKRAVYAGICIFVIVIIGLSIPGERSAREQQLRDFIDKSHSDFLIAEALKPVPQQIHTADSPYDSIFGEGVYNDLSDNSLLLNNKLSFDIIVCLVEKGKQEKTLRNEFIRSGDMYKMAHVPDGEYQLRFFFGRKWNPSALLDKGRVKGAFSADTGFYQLNTKPIQMKKILDSNLVRFSNYELVINDSLFHRLKTIPSDLFFR